MGSAWHLFAYETVNLGSIPIHDAGTDGAVGRGGRRRGGPAHVPEGSGPPSRRRISHLTGESDWMTNYVE